ncbi:hypothetical protein [Flavobacterium sp.]|uniref:hypothetical protein n=1 Tax=Flavobacterium sp. TaxID=239 RepID=UPI0039E652D7
MKVTINTAAANSKDYHNDLYNIIKRSEEDLRTRIPDLTNVLVEVGSIVTNIASNTYGVMTKHSLSNDESELCISVKYRKEPSPEEILKSVNQELKIIKEKYY